MAFLPELKTYSRFTITDPAGRIVAVVGQQYDPVPIGPLHWPVVAPGYKVRQSTPAEAALYGKAKYRDPNLAGGFTRETRYQAIPLRYKSLPGLSAELISDHYTLYKGYIDRINHLQDEYEDAVEDGEKWRAQRISQSLGFLRNAVVLHELYFAGLTQGGAGDIGSVIPADKQAAWKKEFELLGAGSTGWVILAWDPRTKTLFNYTMKEHGEGGVVRACPLLVMDVYEHAYMPQYQLDKQAYINAFMRNIDWDVVRNRLRRIKKTSQ